MSQPRWTHVWVWRFPCGCVGAAAVDDLPRMAHALALMHKDSIQHGGTVSRVEGTVTFTECPSLTTCKATKNMKARRAKRQELQLVDTATPALPGM